VLLLAAEAAYSLTEAFRTIVLTCQTRLEHADE